MEARRATDFVCLDQEFTKINRNFGFETYFVFDWDWNHHY
jgi:hypothetical protein